MPRTLMNTLNSNRDFTPPQQAEGAKLSALIDAAANDLAKLAVMLEKAGYAQDSVGQWFRDGVLVPSPTPRSAAGVIAYSGDK